MTPTEKPQIATRSLEETVEIYRRLADPNGEGNPDLERLLEQIQANPENMELRKELVELCGRILQGRQHPSRVLVVRPIGPRGGRTPPPPSRKGHHSSLGRRASPRSCSGPRSAGGRRSVVRRRRRGRLSQSRLRAVLKKDQRGAGARPERSKMNFELSG
jgi:hypothetical protein